MAAVGLLQVRLGVDPELQSQKIGMPLLTFSRTWLRKRWYCPRWVPLTFISLRTSGSITALAAYPLYTMVLPCRMVYTFSSMGFFFIRRAIRL